MKVRSFSDSEFNGLDNRRGDLRNRTNTLVFSSNVDLTDSKEIKTRAGLEQKVALPNITSAFFTADNTHLYVAASGSIYRVYDDYTTQEIASGLDTSKLYWSEFGNRIGVSGSACGVIRLETEKFVRYPLPRPNQLAVTPIAGDLGAGQYMLTVVEYIDGEATPAAAHSVEVLPEGKALSVTYTPSAYASYAVIYCTELDGSVFYEVAQVENESVIHINGSTKFYGVIDDALVSATSIPNHNGPNAFMSSRWLVSSYHEPSDTTYIYKSAVFSYGLFDIVTQFEALPGRVTLMHSQEKNLLIGTDRGIWVLSAAGTLDRISNTTVPEHVSSVVDSEGTIWFWTSEGLAKGLPYEEVTAERLDPDSSAQVSLGLVKDRHGDKIIVVTKV